MLTIIGAIGLCVISYMILGMFWYSPILFGTIWARITKRGPENVDREKMNLMYGVSAMGALLSAIILYVIMSQVDIKTVYQAVLLGFLVWLGFSLPSTVVQNVFQGKKFLLTMIDSGYHLATILAMSSILYFFIFP